jgi:hypothetical protein
MQPLGPLQSRVLPALLARAPMSPDKLAFVWGQSVGAAVARATSVSLTGTTLVVHAAEPAWAREVQRSRALILERVQRLLGGDVVKKLIIEETSGASRRR